MKEILRVLVGSRGYGLHTPESDVDRIGVVIEDPLQVVGFTPFEQEIHKEGGDYTIFSLRKFLKLALNGNPNILEVLYASALHVTDEGWVLRNTLRDCIVSQEARARYKGYLYKQWLDWEKGKDAEFDWKAGMHAIRLGLMGMEFLSTGRMTMPFIGPERDALMAIREGKVSGTYLTTRINNLLTELENVKSPLPEHPKRDVVERWMVYTYLEEWRNA